MSSVKTIAKLVSQKSKKLASLLERAGKVQQELVAVQKDLQVHSLELEAACQAEPAGSANGKPGNVARRREQPAPSKVAHPARSAGKGEEE